MNDWILLFGDPTITTQSSVPALVNLVVAVIGLALTYLTRRELLSQD